MIVYVKQNISIPASRCYLCFAHFRWYFNSLQDEVFEFFFQILSGETNSFLVTSSYSIVLKTSTSILSFVVSKARQACHLRLFISCLGTLSIRKNFFSYQKIILRNCRSTVSSLHIFKISDKPISYKEFPKATRTFPNISDFLGRFTCLAEDLLEPSVYWLST